MGITREARDPDGTLKLHRRRFFDLGDEGLRQWGEVSADGRADWHTEFDRYYRRK